jgi:hypothetical protein
VDDAHCRWHTLLMGGIECCLWATRPRPGPSLNSNHGQCPARAGLPGHLVEMLTPERLRSIGREEGPPGFKTHRRIWKSPMRWKVVIPLLLRLPGNRGFLHIKFPDALGKLVASGFFLEALLCGTCGRNAMTLPSLVLIGMLTNLVVRFG